MSWTDTYSRLNPTAQNLYKRYAEYRDKNMWGQEPTGQSGDSGIDTTQWKADSGSKAFYLSPAEYNRYDAWYKEEQDYKKQQQTQATTPVSTNTGTTSTVASTTTAPKPITSLATSPSSYGYKPTVPTLFTSTTSNTTPTTIVPAAPTTSTPKLATASTASAYTPKNVTVASSTPTQYTPATRSTPTTSAQSATDRMLELSKATFSTASPENSTEAKYVVDRHLASLPSSTRTLYETYTKGLSSEYPWERRVEGGKTYYVSGYGSDEQVLSEAEYLMLEQMHTTIWNKYYAGQTGDLRIEREKNQAAAATKPPAAKTSGVISSSSEPSYSTQSSISGLLSGTDATADDLSKMYADALASYKASRQSEASAESEAEATRSREELLSAYEASKTKRRKKEVELSSLLSQAKLDKRAAREKTKRQSGLSRANSLNSLSSGTSFFGSVS